MFVMFAVLARYFSKLMLKLERQVLQHDPAQLHQSSIVRARPHKGKGTRQEVPQSCTGGAGHPHHNLVQLTTSMNVWHW